MLDYSLREREREAWLDTWSDSAASSFWVLSRFEDPIPETDGNPNTPLDLELSWIWTPDIHIRLALSWVGFGIPTYTPHLSWVWYHPSFGTRPWGAEECASSWYQLSDPTRNRIQAGCVIRVGSDMVSQHLEQRYFCLPRIRSLFYWIYP